MPRFQVDKDGELTSAEEHEGSDPIVEARLTGGTLHITTKEQISQDTIQCDMRLTGTDQADLRVLAPPDVPAPKRGSWSERRVVNKSLTSSRCAAGRHVTVAVITCTPSSASVDPLPVDGVAAAARPLAATRRGRSSL